MENRAILNQSYLDVFKRRWKLIALLGLLGCVVAFGYSFTESSSYSAETRVLLRPIVTNPFQPNIRPTDSVDLPSEREQVFSERVIALAEQHVPEGTRPFERSQMTVDPVGDSLVLRISYASDNEAEAEAWSNAMALGFLERRQERAAGLVDNLTANLNARIELLQNSSVAGAQDQIRELTRQVSDLEQILTDPGEVLRSPVVTREAGPLPTWMTQLAIVGVFLIIGAAFAVLRDRSDPRVMSLEELQMVAEPVLAHTDFLRKKGQILPGPPNQSQGLDYLHLRLIEGTGNIPRVMTVSPIDRDEIPEYVPEKLAYAIAETGKTVLLVSPYIEINETKRPSFVSVATQKSTASASKITVNVAEIVDDTSVTDKLVSLLPLPLPTWERVPSGQFMDLLEAVVADFDHTIIVTPALMHRFVTGLETIQSADAALLAAEIKNVTSDDVESAVELLHTLGAPYEGVIAIEERNR